MMKFFHNLVAPVSLLVLAACSSNPEESRQANGDFDYIDSKLTPGWSLPDGVSFQFYDMYDVSPAEYRGNVGSDIDIRPPQQVFNLIPGARVDRLNNDYLILMSSENQLNELWGLTQTMLKNDNIAYEQQDLVLLTDWQPLENKEDGSLTGRYRIERIQLGQTYGISVSLFELRENDQPAELVDSVQARYAAIMANKITGQYDKQAQEQARQRALEELNQVPVVMGRDQSDLPIIMARADFDLVWSRLEKTLPLMGFMINDQNRSQGLFETDYSPKSEDEWNKYGLSALAWDDGEYDFLIGDLGSRTSINITDSDGKPVNSDMLELLMPVLEVLLDTNTVNQASQ